jgi:hypothetical protein
MRRSRVTLATTEAADDGLMRTPAAGQREPVDERHARRRRDALHGARQGVEVAAVETLAVDGPRRAADDHHPVRAAQDAFVQRRAPLPGQAFGVVEPGERREIGIVPGRVVEADGRRHERAGKAPAPGLVGAGHRGASGEVEIEGEALVHAGPGAA